MTTKFLRVAAVTLAALAAVAGLTRRRNTQPYQSPHEDNPAEDDPHAPAWWEVTL